MIDLDPSTIDAGARSQIRAEIPVKLGTAPIQGAFRWWLRQVIAAGRALGISDHELRVEAVWQVSDTAIDAPAECQDRIRVELMAIITEELP